MPEQTTLVLFWARQVVHVDRIGVVKDGLEADDQLLVVSLTPLVLASLDMQRHIADIQVVSPLSHVFEAVRILLMKFEQVEPNPFLLLIAAEVKHALFDVVCDVLEVTRVQDTLQVQLDVQIRVVIDSMLLRANYEDRLVIVCDECVRLLVERLLELVDKLCF